jgi:hypothetical protein
MNIFTDKNEFTESAQHILDNSDLLIKADCVIIDDVLYERCENNEYRFFFSTDDYDYLENRDDLVKKINDLLDNKI